ncbi:aminotransferase class III-fold pyridoxal phosphate-dependent enzyme [Actinoplanes sp. NPDC049118]|uniref:aspartate aminotransferase family protein n=1 Tax=Actinoplanes sp. NPDC049118 TaxID=3155769 RepID=UPI0033E56EEA
MTAAVDAPDLTDLTIGRVRRHMGSGRASLGEMLGRVVEVSSAGAWVTAADGRRYLDFGGYGVFILGHRHPTVVAEVRRQLDQHPLATRVFLEPVSARAAEALAEVAPDGLDQVHFVNSGTEATEAAIKLARAHGRTELIAVDGGFHGKSMGALSIIGNPLYQRPFGPLLPGVTQVPFGDLPALRSALSAAAGRACLVLEPVLGEGGALPAPEGYLRGAAEACREFGALLVADEIQTGLGRLGRWWGMDAEAVVPDIMLVGKGLSGGVIPVAAMVTGAELYQPFGRDPFLHSSTFGASPIASAAAIGALRAIKEEDAVAKAASLGTRLLILLHEAHRRHLPGQVAEVRGRGLLLGIEYAAAGLAGDVALELMSRGVLVNHSLNAADVLRLTPPAILADPEVDFFAQVLDDALAAVATRHQPRS